jgi:hypothetical protein
MGALDLEHQMQRRTGSSADFRAFSENRLAKLKWGRRRMDTKTLRRGVEALSFTQDAHPAGPLEQPDLSKRLSEFGSASSCRAK